MQLDREGGGDRDRWGSGGTANCFVTKYGPQLWRGAALQTFYHFEIQEREHYNVDVIKGSLRGYIRHLALADILGVKRYFDNTAQAL